MQVCRLPHLPALKSQAGKPRANEHPTFHQHFRQLAGMSPLRYRNGYASMSEAGRLMLNEHYDVTTAAYAVGYESLSHFSREYSRMFGESPKRYYRVKKVCRSALINPALICLEQFRVSSPVRKH